MSLQTKLKTCSICERESKLWKSNPPTCKGCMKRTPIKVNTTKRQQAIDVGNSYYKDAINANIERNGGVCKCDKCSVVINYPIGRNVSHILGKGARSKLYLHPLNHFILCFRHVIAEESGGLSKMKIHDEWQRRRLELLKTLI